MLDAQTIASLSIADIRRALRAGEYTPRELIGAVLENIRRMEPDVQAWAFLDADHVARELDRVEQLDPSLPLYGVPIGMKDIIDTADMPTGLGAEVYRNRRPEADAAVVQTLRAAGAVILGKTVTTEMAYFSPGKTRNPHDLNRTPGGSSSGSAAAVAAGMVPVATATQAVGSTVRPASFCGIWSFKPTYGNWDINGSLRIYPTLDTLSIYARLPADLLLIDHVLATGRSAVPERLDQPRIGIFVPPHAESVAGEWRAALERAQARFSDAGAVLVPVETVPDYEHYLAASICVMEYEAAHTLDRISPAVRAQFSATLQALHEKGMTVARADYDAAMATLDRGRPAVDAQFAGYDVVLTPGATGEAPQGLDSTGDPVFIRAWNALHLPSANVPMGEGGSSMPIGVQLLASRGRDARLHAILQWIAAN